MSRKIKITNARKNLYNITKELVMSHEPIEVESKHGNVVILALEDWNAIQETIFLSNIPGMVKSIKNGMKEPLSESQKYDW